jgi:hypothetical protein
MSIPESQSVPFGLGPFAGSYWAAERSILVAKSHREE